MYLKENPNGLIPLDLYDPLLQEKAVMEEATLHSMRQKAAKLKKLC
jgi:hypothetical protein